MQTASISGNVDPLTTTKWGHKLTKLVLHPKPQKLVKKNSPYESPKNSMRTRSCNLISSFMEAMRMLTVVYLALFVAASSGHPIGVKVSKSLLAATSLGVGDGLYKH